MGSGTSKARRSGSASARSSCSSFSSSSVAPPASSCSRSSTSSLRRYRARSVFQSSCLGSSSRTYDTDDDDDQISYPQEDGIAGYESAIRQTEPDSREVAIEQFNKLKVEQPNESAHVSSNSDDLCEWFQAGDVNNPTIGIDSPSPGPASSGRSLNLSSRFLSHFSFVPGSDSFRLGRANSIGSARDYPVSPVTYPINNNEEDFHVSKISQTGTVVHENPEHRNLHLGQFSSPIARNNLNISGNFWPRRQTSSLSNTPRNYFPAVPVQDLVRNRDTESTRAGSHAEINNASARYGDWRNGARDPMDRNVQFSRTLSVGRLRDRVLRRPSFSDLMLYPMQQDRGRSGSNGGDDETRTATSAFTSLTSNHPVFRRQSLGNETLQSRESRPHHMLQHRSNFLERRRRIRSQVRALERLGSRSVSLSGHERSCILSGRHRTNRCICNANGQESSSNDDSGARASISRIVMLAEALFEVLDEIHQQAVALSSRPSASSIGSVPAPSEVVESLPIQIYSKSTRFPSEEVAQCYICLVEYEEGDSMRILPCQHEFHRTCIDKWLKEIHRVCPLCRGDICRSASPLTQR